MPVCQYAGVFMKVERRTVLMTHQYADMPICQHAGSSRGTEEEEQYEQFEQYIDM
jgi:hypothetical protein